MRFKRAAKPGSASESASQPDSSHTPKVAATSHQNDLSRRLSSSPLPAMANRWASDEAPPVVYEALRDSGAPLDADIRKLMERRFHHNFAHVRVHTDEPAVESARAVGALAYTVGSSIFFDRGRYAPHQAAGRSLLAHELVHTIQQSGKEVPARTAGSPWSGQRLRVEPATSAGEAEARGIAASAATPGSLFSPALQLGSKRSHGAAVLQRAVTTSGGDWDTDNYDAVKDVDISGNPLPAAQNWRGADITLRFKPNSDVNAELLGLTQSVQSYVGNALSLTPAAATRAIPAADAKAINTGRGETDEGTAIDRAQGYNNPIYPVKSAASASLADKNTSASWGQNGWRFTKAKRLQHQDAKLIDHPRRAGAQKDSRQVFEVAALATKGAQAGTYYGSVRWGWRTDGTENLTKIDLQKVSDGVPSSTFIKAAGIWDKGTSSTGAANVKLGAPEIMVTTVPVALTPQALVMRPIALPVGTRLQIVSGFHPPFLPNTGTVKVVDGPNIGVVGDISEPASKVPVITAERP